MSAQAVQVLLFWAAQNSRKVQQKFISYYNQKRSAYQHDEASSGRFEFDDLLITSDGMKQMIWNFEGENGTKKTDFARVS